MKVRSDVDQMRLGRLLVIISLACLRRQRGCQARVTSHYVRYKNIEVTLSLTLLVDACGVHKSDGGGSCRYVPVCESVCL